MEYILSAIASNSVKDPYKVFTYTVGYNTVHPTQYSLNAPVPYSTLFWKRNMHTCAHFCYTIVHRCSTPLDITVVLHKFGLQATVDHHVPFVYSGHCTISINCYKNILLQRQQIAVFEMIDTKDSSTAWCRPGHKPLSEPTTIISLTHVCATRPQWVWNIWIWHYHQILNVYNICIIKHAYIQHNSVLMNCVGVAL